MKAPVPQGFAAYMADGDGNYQTVHNPEKRGARFRRARPASKLRSGDRDDAQNGEQEEDEDDGDQDLGAGHRCSGKGIHAKETGNRSHDKENENPFEHRNASSNEISPITRSYARGSCQAGFGRNFGMKTGS